VETRKRLVSAAMDEKTVRAWQKKRLESETAGLVSFDGQEPLTLAELGK
jgi:hypothetical protein